ncbi:hypothetical protein WOSG25_041600 [Weissella oryzae SG25]|uniref:Uncharacterized protein n=1 Tax=Weissella oryzae (strain DSM 25784 / JCM 18191 / LMG 30913 / SG25) TaxID=1329250 RepID=A0A069CTD2_WEIOS|nr:hypothetical protein [Weissella oryzae]GAK30719.1 hypothetical protein WOSG25_041600 [Weissella oryzae SG25]
MKVLNRKTGEVLEAWQCEYIDDFDEVPEWVELLVLNDDMFYATCSSEWIVAGIGYANNGDYLLRTLSDKLSIVKKEFFEKSYEVVE